MPIHILIKSCLFHYEFEFIHPFADGNGRMGRMWQTLLLSCWKPVFHWLPVETLIREQVTEQVERLMMVLENETFSAKELLERLGIRHRPTFSNNYLRPALELGLIEMTVPDKPNSNRQKYRQLRKQNSLKLFFWPVSSEPHGRSLHTSKGFPGVSTLREALLLQLINETGC